MKRMMLPIVSVAILALSCSAALAGNGNNLPAGERFTLNVIAYDNCPAGDFTDSNTHRIAVKADYSVGSGLTSTQAGKNFLTQFISTNTIKLTAAVGSQDVKDIQVLDGNACSKGGAELMLPPDPFSCPETDPLCLDSDPTFQNYKVYVRLVGKPNTKIGVTTCAVDDMDTAVQTDDTIVCSTENVVKVRATGKGSMQFDDVSKELLTICLDTSVPSDGRCDVRYALFDPALYNYFWQWNTEGKAHAQLVFVPVPD